MNTSKMKILKISKKAVFFTFLSILFSAMFLLMAARETSTINLESTTSSVSVTAANSIIKSIDKSYIPSILKISGNRAIQAILCEENSTEKFIANFSESSRSILVYGNFTNWSGTGSACAVRYMQNYSLNESFIKLQSLIRTNFNMNLNIIVDELSFYQEDPWHVLLEMNSTISLAGSAASWNKTITTLASIPINNMEDPLFMVYTQGAYSNKIITKEKLVTDQFTLAEFKDHLANMTYYRNPLTPSFIMRLNNNLNASACCGISTLINPAKITWLSNDNQSFSDINYFTRKYENCVYGSLYNITSVLATYPQFKLDFTNVYMYNLSSSAVQRC